jgi:2,3-bisphosphoglycerate-independent phosphoglycerate mutase
MVGHTGVFAAAVKAIETVDDCVGQIVRATLARGGVLLVTADHGNAELFPVEAIYVASDSPEKALLASGGKLADIAVTALELLGLPVPREMTARSLLPKAR